MILPFDMNSLHVKCIPMVIGNGTHRKREFCYNNKTNQFLRGGICVEL